MKVMTMAIMALSFVTISCTNVKKSTDTTVTVEQQVCFLKHFSHISENDCDLIITIDQPVNGPKSLVDSINCFLNEQLYLYFDHEEEKHFPYGDVFSSDIPNLAEHYRKTYSAYFDVDNSYTCEFGSHCLELNMVAQTSKYVTYESVSVFYGEGLEESRIWVTFAKSDGHKLKDVITTMGMFEFIQTHPELRNSDVWDDILQKSEGGEPLILNNAGLLNDSLVFEYTWCNGVFEDYPFDLKAVKPFLSHEAQELID